MQDVEIVGINLLEDGGVELVYLKIPDDAKANGLLWKHAVHIPAKSDYDDELEAVHEALRALLLDVLDDESRVEVAQLIEDEDEDDEEDEE